MAETNKEYASMYFGFTAGAFADTIFNVGNESIAASLKTFRKEMQQKCSPANALAFDKAFQELTVQTENRGMQMNDKLKYVLESRVFNIPPRILMENDEQQRQFQGVDCARLEMDLDKQIGETEKKIIACEFARAKLEDSIAQSQQLAAEFENVKEEIQEQSRFAQELSDDVTRTAANLRETSSALKDF